MTSLVAKTTAQYSPPAELLRRRPQTLNGCIPLRPGTAAEASEQAKSPAARLALRVGPVLADADVDRERRVELVGADHLRAHELLHRAHLGVRHFEEQLVVHL